MLDKKRMVIAAIVLFILACLSHKIGTIEAQNILLTVGMMLIWLRVCVKD